MSTSVFRCFFIAEISHDICRAVDLVDKMEEFAIIDVAVGTKSLYTKPPRQRS